VAQTLTPCRFAAVPLGKGDKVLVENGIYCAPYQGGQPRSGRGSGFEPLLPRAPKAEQNRSNPILATPAALVFPLEQKSYPVSRQSRFREHRQSLPEGSLEINSQPGTGTRVTRIFEIWVPDIEGGYNRAVQSA